MRNHKWLTILLVALGIGAILAIIYLILRTTNILTRLTERENNVIQTVD
ncbi:MAG: hypothetical protein RBT76_13355 [candidate division Zixibacteria bacterium]|jgi:hypothetical protein|nr:hypothetical protein [candidate division Zixibacteria bacterium]